MIFAVPRSNAVNINPNNPVAAARYPIDSGKGYNIETVDMSDKGDLVIFKEEDSIIEINEKHPLYLKASKNGYLDSFVRDLAFMEIARDYCGGNLSIYDSIYNELAKIAIEISL